MSFRALLEPIIDEGIKNTYFFEGRLLSAKDLRDQQQANQQHRNLLGRIAGLGVVEGLDVTVENSGAGGTGPVVRVSKGTAINSEGAVLNLPLEYVDLQLSRIIDAPELLTDVFKDCPESISDSLVPSGAGIYLLLMSPAAKYQGYAQKSGLQQQGIANNCGRNKLVEGVQFRLVKFDPAALTDLSNETRNLLHTEFLNNNSPVAATDIQRLSKLQNITAHACYGTEALRLSQTDYFKTVADAPVGIDKLIGADGGIDSCEVPLALVYWTFDGIGFLDNWAVKRKVHDLKSPDADIAYNSVRSRAIYEAMLFQFQDQLENLLLKKLTTTQVVSLSAFDYLHFLPPAGVLPIFKTGGKGFTANSFFSRQPHRSPEFISESQVRDILYDSALLAPLRTSEKQQICLYKTWQRDFREANGQGSLPHLIFTSAHAVYQAEAKYDVARWDYSHYTRL